MKQSAANIKKAKTKRLIRQLVVALLFAAGFTLILYPTVSNWFSKRNHSRLIQNYNVTVEQLAQMDIDKELLRAEKYNNSLSGKDVTEPFIPDSGYAVPKEYYSILNIDGIIGYIEIPAIGAYLPIYHGVGEDALQKGIGHMNATAFPIGGEGCHSVLTGHRGLPSSELFSNLVKLKNGDFFYIHVLNKTLVYIVFSIETIEPYDTNNLRPQDGKDYISLITCTPYSINSHRLVVTGERTDDIATGGDRRPPSDIGKVFERYFIVIAIVVLIAAIVAVFVFVALSKRKREADSSAGSSKKRIAWYKIDRNRTKRKQ